MKKILALALSMMMLFALCACGGETVVTTDDAATTTADAVATEEVADTTAEVVDDQPEKKTFRVAMECAYAPYNWAQETDANGAVAIADTNMFAYGLTLSSQRRLQKLTTGISKS